MLSKLVLLIIYSKFVLKLYDYVGYRKFVAEAGKGGRGIVPLQSVPPVLSTEPWDGKDGHLIEEDEFSLDELMGDDETKNDEL